MAAKRLKAKITLAFNIVNLQLEGPQQFLTQNGVKLGPLQGRLTEFDISSTSIHLQVGGGGKTEIILLIEDPEPEKPLKMYVPNGDLDPTHGCLIQIEIEGRRPKTITDIDGQPFHFEVDPG